MAATVLNVETAIRLLKDTISELGFEVYPLKVVQLTDLVIYILNFSKSHRDGNDFFLTLRSIIRVHMSKLTGRYIVTL